VFLKEVVTPMGLLGFTKLFLMHASVEIGHALRICADPRNHPVLIHCASGAHRSAAFCSAVQLTVNVGGRSGKDRTGLVVALLQSACGVDRQEVIENYHLSERFLSPVADEIREENGRKGLSLSLSLLNRCSMFDSKGWGRLSTGRRVS